MLKCKSKRTFGVEIETFNEDREKFNKCYAEVNHLGFNCVHDGSIKAMNPVEIVSDVLSGQEGYNTIEKMCKVLTKYKMGVNLTTGYHVHIGAKDLLENTILELVSLKDFVNYTKEFAIKDRAYVIPQNLTDIRKEVLYNHLSQVYPAVSNWTEIDRKGSFCLSEKFNNNLLKLKRFNFRLYGVLSVDNKDREEYYQQIRELDIAEKEVYVGATKNNEHHVETMIKLNDIAKQRESVKDKIYTKILNQKIPDDSFVLVKRAVGDNTYKVKQLFAFYLVFGDVLNSFLPKSRRGNYFCKDLKDKYNLDEIMKIKTFDDFDKVWYKQKDTQQIKVLKGGKYHESRYYYTNFHSLARHGTVEIRSHSGTTQFRKIIRWLHLHLEIIDKVAEDKRFEDFIYMANQVSDLETKTKIMFDYLDTDKNLVEVWIKRQKLLKNK